MEFQKNPFAMNTNQQRNSESNLGGRRSTTEIREELQKAKPRYNYDIKTPEPLPARDTQLEQRKNQMAAVRDLMRK